MAWLTLLLADGSRVDSAKLIGNGTNGFVVRYEDHVLKIPNLFGYIQPNGDIEPHEDNDLYLDGLEIEKKIYNHLQHVHGVAECLGCTSNGIRLTYYSNGDLQAFISGHQPPSMAWRWKWALQATDIIERCHERGVLVLDIALRNFLLTDDFDLRIIDFANSWLVAPHIDITRVDINGGTVLLDLLYLSAVIYSILTWQDFRTHCCDESDWPEPDAIPDMSQHDFAPIVQKCWLREYTCIQDLALEIRQYALPPPAEPLDVGASVLPSTEVDVK